MNYNKPLSILRYPFEVRKVRRLVPNDLNLLLISNDFFMIGEPFKARMCIYYMVETRKGGYKRLERFLCYLASLCRPFGVDFVHATALSNFKKFGNCVV